MKLLVTIGYHSQASGRAGHYDKAAVLLVDWATRSIVKELQYVSPPGQHPPEGYMRFTHAHLSGSELLVTTATEILVIDVEAWRINRVLSHRHFNDLHHVIRAGDCLYACNTGLQAVHRLTAEGEILGTYPTNGHITWDVYDPRLDYRAISTKPHEIHPNYLFEIDGEIWVTRFHKCDAARLSDVSDTIPLEVGNPHDGVVAGDRIWFTTTNGHVVSADASSRRAADVFDLNEFKNGDERVRARSPLLGWCRGVLPVDEDHALVGFSQFRYTRHREFARWLVGRQETVLPSRIALYALREGRLVAEMPFVDELAGAAIFSILPLPDHVANESGH